MSNRDSFFCARSGKPDQARETSPAQHQIQLQKNTEMRITLIFFFHCTLAQNKGKKGKISEINEDFADS